MNKRQKKKLYKQTFIKIRKLHPQKGDVICLQFDLQNVDMDTIYEMAKFVSNCSKNKIFGDAKIIAIPANVNYLRREEAQTIIQRLQSIVDQMGE